MKKMQIRFDPDTRTLTVTNRVIHLNKAETKAIAEAGNPFVVPRVAVFIATLRKLSGAALSRAMLAAAQRITYADLRPGPITHTIRQWTEIIDTPDGPIKVRTFINHNSRTGNATTTVVRMDPRTNLITRIVTKHRPPAVPVTTTETYPSIFRIKLTTRHNIIDRRMATRKPA